ncbi:MAG: RNA polymerase sigma factor [Flavobacteriaceae bacterium]|nr:RNA polymerase sigma factor [Bacteroidia bacterium]MBT8269490.1 RNA polymerase sigma factor [Bacteroidia bacterium]MBT8286918.1 RNA polymerase sigma factor [Bacteroidia bacterium]NNF73842.1 RNA polymerase sigma factor [Flavobacteriaceae bacterium]NNK72884.1 RNA polymerase sigma factor [Flavobacteriaceae bacterium]
MRLAKHNITQLVELCKSGNQFAQLEIYNRYYKAMYNTAFRIVKDSFEAEDIMQEAFLSAFTKLDSLKESATFGSWLKRIVINNSIYHYNKSDKYDNVPLDDVLYKVEDNSGIPEDAEIKSLQAKQILETMKTLKDNYRIALTLHLIEGYDYEEISGIMNLSYANCRTTISRAKDKLRQNLQPMAEY